MYQEKKIDLGSLAGRQIGCGCGRTHEITTKKILLGPDVVSGIGGMLDEINLKGRALLVADRNTWEVAGAAAEVAVAAGGRDTARFIFPDEELHTDEYAVGSVLMALEGGIDFIVAVGSGTINDICRFVASSLKLPYIVVGTAPSMDGYASAVTPIVRGGFKMTRLGTAPMAVIGDTDILIHAPLKMMAAGLGDIFGKFTAQMDWTMSERLLGDYRCEYVAGTMRTALDACMAAAPSLKYRDADTVGRLMEALVLSGIAIQMVSDSRPASGCEHHVAHFFEMRDMAQGRHSSLHGDKVGLAELIMLRLYEKFFAMDIPESATAPSREAHEASMRRDLGAFAETLIGQNCSAKYYDAATAERAVRGVAADWEYWKGEAAKLPGVRMLGEESIRGAQGPVRPADLGYSREDTRLAIRYAMELRDKFTILRLAELTGRLDGLAEELADEFC